MQKWAKSVGADPGAIDNIWGKNTKAAFEEAASSHLQAPITFKNADEAWAWYDRAILGNDPTQTEEEPKIKTLTKL
jgi:hypothetical protein